MQRFPYFFRVSKVKISRRRLGVAVVLSLLLFVFVPSIASRIFAPTNRIRSFTNGESEPIRFQGGVKILAFNIAHGRGLSDDNWSENGAQKSVRISEIANLLIAHDADVVVLNEVDFNSTWSGGQNQAAAIAMQANYPYRVEQRNLDFRILHWRWSFGNAVLSRFPITASSVVNFPPLKSWEDWLVGCKRGVVVTVEPPSQPAFRILAVHLEHRSEQVRVESAKIMVELAAEHPLPLVAAGDFNSTPTGFPNSRKSNSGRNALDQLISSSQFQHFPNKFPEAQQLTFSSYDPQSTIDWILIPTSWRFEQYDAIDTDLSDHKPVKSLLIRGADY